MVKGGELVEAIEVLREVEGELNALFPSCRLSVGVVLGLCARLCVDALKSPSLFVSPDSSGAGSGFAPYGKVAESGQLASPEHRKLLSRRRIVAATLFGH